MGFLNRHCSLHQCLHHSSAFGHHFPIFEEAAARRGSPGAEPCHSQQFYSLPPSSLDACIVGFFVNLFQLAEMPRLCNLDFILNTQGRARFQLYQKLLALVAAVIQAVGQLTYIRPFVPEWDVTWLAVNSLTLVAGAMVLVHVSCYHSQHMHSTSALCDSSREGLSDGDEEVQGSAALDKSCGARSDCQGRA